MGSEEGRGGEVAGSSRELPCSLDEVLGLLAAKLTLPSARCHVLPRPDGTLEISWRSRGGDFAVILEKGRDGPPSVSSVELGSDRLVASVAGWSVSQCRQLLRRTRAAMMSLWDRGLEDWLAGAAPQTHGLPSTVEDFLALFGGRLGIGAALWNPWVLREVVAAPEEEPGRFRLVFDDGGENRRQLVFVDPSQESQVGEVVLETHLGAVCMPLAGDDEVRQGDRLQSLTAAVAFVFQRSIRSEGQGLEAAAGNGVRPEPDPSAESHPEYGIDSLTDNCCRGGFAAGLDPSRFFRVWGSLDSFGLSAVIGREPVDISVFHASRECSMGTDLLSGIIDPGARTWQPESFADRVRFEEFRITDVDDMTVLTGGEERLGELLTDLVEGGSDRGISLFQGCDYHMIGDNPELVCTSCLEGRGPGVRFMQPVLAQFREVDSGSWWAKLMDEMEPAGRSTGGGPSINIVGCERHGSPPMAELEGLLAEVGVSVSSVLLPFVSPGAHQRFCEAELTVVSPWKPVREVFTAPLEARGHRYLELALPFGAAGTLRWVGQVCDALGVPGPSPAVKNRWLERFAPRLEEYRGEIVDRGLRAAVVFDKGTVQELVSEEFFFGIDLLELLGDTGFELTIVDANRGRRPLANDPGRIAELGRAGIDVLDCPEGISLAELCAENGISLVYCDVAGGAWVKRHGISAFAVTDLEPGLSGMERTVCRLLQLARLKLFGWFPPSTGAGTGGEDGGR